MNQILFWLTESWLVWAIKPEGCDYLERYKCANEWRWFERVRQMASIRVYLHRFVGGDVQEGLHDHPWSWCLTLVLCGSYIEQFVDCLSIHTGLVKKRRRVRWFNYITKRKFHRVVSAEPNTWTFVICGPEAKLDNGERKGWGFVKDISGWNSLHDGSWIFEYSQPFQGERTEDFMADMPTGKAYRIQQSCSIHTGNSHNDDILDDVPPDQRGIYKPLVDSGDYSEKHS